MTAPTIPDVERTTAHEVSWPKDRIRGADSLLTYEPERYDLPGNTITRLVPATQLAALTEKLAAAEAASQALVAATKMSNYGDASDFVWPKSSMRKEGEPAWGWICEKHGLGYQGGCICCRKDHAKYVERKNQEARWARDDAIRAATEVLCRQDRTALDQLLAEARRDERERCVRELRAYAERLKPGAESSYTQDDMIAESCAELVEALPDTPQAEHFRDATKMVTGTPQAEQKGGM